MIDQLDERLFWMRKRLGEVRSIDRIGRVKRVIGLVIESEGPDVGLGEICEVRSPHAGISLLAEVVGFRDNSVLLIAFGELHAVHPGCEVVASAARFGVPYGEGVVGRVIDGLGSPIDAKGPLAAEVYTGNLHRQAPNPMLRKPVELPFATGIRALDAFTPIGEGQRVGIFAGSGVGKSTLLGMIARGSEADVNVLALVGERGRELRQFVEQELGPEGMQRSVVVISTSDQPAPLRLRAAYLATTIAELFREAGKRVMLMMDSLTRFCIAQREVGLAIGEPPSVRGYTPSVFSALPRVLERAGNSDQGSITGIYTILVDGDDINDPIADASRGILDGHVVLSRTLANANHYPAIDILGSVSRLAKQLYTPEENAVAGHLRDLMAVYDRNEDLINIGAYKKGNNARLDEAMAKREPLLAFLNQESESLEPRESTFEQLLKLGR